MNSCSEDLSDKAYIAPDGCISIEDEIIKYDVLHLVRDTRDSLMFVVLNLPEKGKLWIDDYLDGFQGVVVNSEEFNLNEINKRLFWEKYNQDLKLSDDFNKRFLSGEIQLVSMYERTFTFTKEKKVNWKFVRCNL